jgi:uncharacterized SAM-binding protein YcdF (DUF218 family)
MFYLTSKVLGFFLQPSTLILAMLCVGVLLTATAWRRLARWLMLGGLSAILVFGMLPAAELFLQPLENRFPRPDASFDVASTAGIIVLGGVLDGPGWERGELAGLGGTAERLTEAIALSRRYPGVRIIFSGGSAETDYPPEAELVRSLLIALGLDEARLTLESQSRSTHENAVLTAQLLKPRPDQTWLLVTSAAHMPRSVGSFRKAGVNVVAWPVDFRSPLQLRLMSVYPSYLDGLHDLDNAAHEYLGLLVYYLTGRTDALFPAP